MVILDFPGRSRRVFKDPITVLNADKIGDVREVIAAAEAAAADNLYAVGFVSYEAAPAFDSAFQVRGDGRMPLAWFGVYEGWSSELPRLHEVRTLDWSLPNRAKFIDAVQRIREEIAAGHTYQVNLTARMTAEFHGDAFTLYEALRRAQGIGYHAFIDTGAHTILSASPELFFELHAGRIKTRPMKGTRARGRFTAEDDAAAHDLTASEKDRAENLMIVDLLRNDIGRVAETGSVEVTSLFDVERYRTIFQMTSVIEGRIPRDTSLVNVFDALFPCGSVTGAPKISTMRLIADMEAAPREVYCGAIGIIEPGGSATFNVPIRTVWMQNDVPTAFYGTGAGITYDSDPAAEYDEIVAKSAVLTESWPAFELIETMRMEDGELIRLDRHIARVMDSARYFGIPVDETDLRSTLKNVSAAGRARVRLLLSQAGVARAELLSFDEADPARIALASAPVQSTERFLFHKTTNRRMYDERAGRDHEGNPAWDTLLWNERGEITEFTRGNVVVELDGDLLTPIRECGLLAGVFRGELLDNGTIRERVIRLEDLARATRIWLINSLREWVAIELSLLR